MHSRVEKEQHKVSSVPLSNACPHPWTVMIMHLYAETASRAMEGPRWTQNLACLTE
jgi:hypothetical protein